MTIYDYSVPKTDGDELNLSEFKGKVILIVNTATGCGLPPNMKHWNKCMKDTMIKDWKLLISPAISLDIKPQAQMKKCISFVNYIIKLSFLR